MTPPPPLWPCNKVLKPNFQSVISQTNNDCSLLSLILAKLLFLDISCENIFALSIAVWSKPRPSNTLIFVACFVSNKAQKFHRSH